MMRKVQAFDAKAHLLRQNSHGTGPLSENRVEAGLPVIESSRF
jgi:hypothetical protein